MFEIPGRSRQEVIQGNDRVAFAQQPVTHVGADEARGSGDNNAQSVIPSRFLILTNGLRARVLMIV